MTQRQPLTILFADVSGSTKLFETRGDETARRIVSGVLNVLGEITQHHGGRVIKTIGDEVMCTFPGPLNGLLAATDMQKRVSSDPAFIRDNLAIRVGLHHGDTLLEDGDVYGDAVNTAARMSSLAKREQIVTTASTVSGVTNVGPLRTRALGTARVSGKLLPIEIVDVMWQEDTSNVTTVQRVVKLVEQGPRKQRLLLRYRSQSYEIDELAPPFSLGREASNNLMIDAEWVSRTHATIEYKRGHWVLGDRSTNGTWVRLGDGDELRLHRDELHLRRTGTISLGQETSLNPDYVLTFQCMEA
ncbi:adenylate/guanylate cyclase domain-containing protein [Tahibacter amnicola]|uniref:Adenylate/guanylate cyclase domain-containing protein n=1 Tax=Tahibacter amnicola TaxID=2976241 RepID=A0ABY6BHI9_9GAMM|nr:adenylate/guanylate cyclase domain-containing protein [Tahibacter amnicola]UXI69486.1 adenylate/guanylate cyclase domain-containing protein [Tahibacter amnicola]